MKVEIETKFDLDQKVILPSGNIGRITDIIIIGSIRDESRVADFDIRYDVFTNYHTRYGESSLKEVL